MKTRRPVKQIRLRPGMSVQSLAREMEATGVLGAGRLGEASRLLAEILQDPNYTIFLSVAGPLVPAGLRLIIADLIRRGFVHALVTSGANLGHDLIEAFGHKHYVGSFHLDDRTLLRQHLNRIGDLLVEEEAFITVEKKIHRLLDKISKQEKTPMAPSRLLQEIGKHVRDPNSILRQATLKDIPIFSPGIFDSLLGLNLWSYAQTHNLRVDPIPDVSRIINLALDSTKLAVIILGGGTPKHHTLLSTIFRDGVDAAIQITTDTPEAGSFSGAPLNEAISWRKVKKHAYYVNVTGDATICFPFIVASALTLIARRR